MKNEWRVVELGSEFDVRSDGAVLSFPLPLDFDGDSIEIYYDSIGGVKYTFFSITGLYMNDGAYYCEGEITPGAVYDEYVAEVRERLAEIDEFEALVDLELEVDELWDDLAFAVEMRNIAEVLLIAARLDEISHRHIRFCNNLK
jgi:hypothetical protein